MKRFLVYGLGLILLVAAVVGVFLAVDNSRDDKSKSPNPTNFSAATASKKACSIFNLADAKQLLGSSAKGGDNPNLDNSMEDLAVTSCIYTQDSGSNAPVSSGNTASLLVRAPLTTDGVQSNQNQFSQAKPTNVQDVAGYGTSAYWDSEHGQLDILKTNTWYILSFGPTTPASRSLQQTRQLADLLIDKM